MLSKRFFDEWAKRRLETLIQEGKMPDQVIVGFYDPFGDSETILCSECGTPAFIRPWLHKFVKEHNIKVLCVCCVEPKDLKEQIAMDFANIEKQISREKKDHEKTMEKNPSREEEKRQQITKFPWRSSRARTTLSWRINDLLHLRNSTLLKP